MKKIRSIINFLFVLLLFNGCMQNTAFFGPAVTVASTGNIYQAGLSYGSNLAIKKITGKSPIENINIMKYLVHFHTVDSITNAQWLRLKCTHVCWCYS